MRGSFTAVICPNVGERVRRVSSRAENAIQRHHIHVVQRIEHLRQHLQAHPFAKRERAAQAAHSDSGGDGLRPALRLMNTPLMVGRAAVPWIVLLPVVMLNGSGEYAVSEVVSWNPWLKRSHARSRLVERRVNRAFKRQPAALIVVRPASNPARC